MLVHGGAVTGLIPEGVVERLKMVNLKGKRLEVTGFDNKPHARARLHELYIRAVQIIEHTLNSIGIRGRGSDYTIRGVTEE